MDEPRKLHPVIWVAAISVTVLSAVGVAALTGILPHGDGQSPAAAKIEPLAAVPAVAPPVLVAPPAAPVAAAAATAPAIAAPPQAITAPSAAAPPEPIAAPPAAKKPVKPKPVHVAQAKSTSAADYPPPDAAIPPPGTPYPPHSPSTPYPRELRAPAPCMDCATVETVRTLQQRAQGSGLGAVAGGLVGGLLGHQVGGGSGRDVATVVGAVAGGFAGNEVEKSRGGSVSYEVVLRMEDGSNRVYKQQNPPPWHPGDRVRVVNGEVLPR